MSVEGRGGGRGPQFLDQLYFENFKGARDEEDRLAKEAAVKARKVALPLPPCSRACTSRCLGDEEYPDSPIWVLYRWRADLQVPLLVLTVTMHSAAPC